MLDATHGPAPGDPYCAPYYGGRYLDEVTTPPGSLRIAYQRTPLSGVPVAPECVQAADDALNGGRVHGGQAAEPVLRQLAHLMQTGHGEELRRRELGLRQNRQEDGRGTLVGAAQQVRHLIVEDETFGLRRGIRRGKYG